MLNGIASRISSFGVHSINGLMHGVHGWLYLWHPFLIYIYTLSYIVFGFEETRTVLIERNFLNVVHISKAFWLHVHFEFFFLAGGYVKCLGWV